MLRVALIVAAAGMTGACAGFWTTPEQRAQMPGTLEYQARMAHLGLSSPTRPANALVPGYSGASHLHENPIFSLYVRDGLLFRTRESPTPIAVISGTAAHDGPVIP